MGTFFFFPRCRSFAGKDNTQSIIYRMMKFGVKCKPGQVLVGLCDGEHFHFANVLQEAPLSLQQLDEKKHIVYCIDSECKLTNDTPLCEHIKLDFAQPLKTCSFDVNLYLKLLSCEYVGWFPKHDMKLDFQFWEKLLCFFQEPEETMQLFDAFVHSYEWLYPQTRFSAYCFSMSRKKNRSHPKIGLLQVGYIEEGANLLWRTSGADITSNLVPIYCKANLPEDVLKMIDGNFAMLAGCVANVKIVMLPHMPVDIFIFGACDRERSVKLCQIFKDHDYKLTTGVTCMFRNDHLTIKSFLLQAPSCDMNNVRLFYFITDNQTVDKMLHYIGDMFACVYSGLHCDQIAVYFTSHGEQMQVSSFRANLAWQKNQISCGEEEQKQVKEALVESQPYEMMDRHLCGLKLTGSMIEKLQSAFGTFPLDENAVTKYKQFRIDTFADYDAVFPPLILAQGSVC